MRVVVNAVAAKVGGTVTVLRALAAELARRPAAHRFVFYVPPEVADPGIELPAHLEWHVSTVGHAGSLRRLWWDQVTLRRRLRRHRADVLFSFADYAQFFCRLPQLLTLHNSLYFSSLYRRHILPQRGWRFRLEFALRRWLICRSVEAADAVLAPSASMLETVREAVPLPPGKAAVNHHGAPSHLLGEEPARDYQGAIRLLFPAYYYDHKGFDTALEALRLLRRRHGARFRLVTTADPDWDRARSTFTAQRDRALLDELLRDAAIEPVGLLPYEQLLALYRQCHLLCYPTLTESFGHALVEAMQAGLPVAASDIPVNRELAGDAALYFAPLKAEELAACVEDIVSQPERRQALIQRGRERAQSFSWAAHVRCLLEVLEQLAAKTG